MVPCESVEKLWDAIGRVSIRVSIGVDDSLDLPGYSAQGAFFLLKNHAMHGEINGTKKAGIAAGPLEGLSPRT
jgi:hypothetical protein